MVHPAKWLFTLWITLALALAVMDAVAADPPEKKGITLSASAAGVRRFAPGKWSSMSVQAANHMDVEGTGTLAVYLNKETQYQFARQMWVPPKSIRTTWLPVRAPKELGPGKGSFDVTLMPLVESANREVIHRREGEEMLRGQPIPADVEPIKTAGIFRKVPPDGMGGAVDLDSDAYEMMAVARLAAEYSRIILEFPDDFVPPHPAMWESLDQLILCGDRIVEDSVGLAVLRDWLFRGGQLCVFLDRTKPETVAAILGHANSYQVIDRVELDEYTIDVMSQPPGQPSTDRRRFETPPELVRVVADGAEVQCQINGWPAAFWQRAGDGRVLFIALSPDGWRPSEIRPGLESLPENSDPVYRTQVALTALGLQFFLPRMVEPNANDVIRPILQQQIGYRIPSRALAIGCFGLNGLALLIGGVWLARRNRLDQLALLVPLLACVTTGVFLWIGRSNNRSVPDSAAFTQIVRYMAETNSAHVSGVVAMYQQESQKLPVAGGPNGLLLPGTRPADGTTHRLMWTDSDSGQWLNVTMPAASVQFATFDQSIHMESQVTARGRFGPRGFEGQMPTAELPDPSDALIAALPGPSSGVHLQRDGSFLTTPEDVLSSDQFLQATVVSDESRRHRDIYRSLLTPRNNSRFASNPTLFVWTKPQLGVISVPADTVQRGSALAAVPLKMERTPPATEFTIPATFLRVESVVGEKGQSLAYGAHTGKWLPKASRATNTRLRFELPASVLPCRITQAHITINLTAPSRELLVNAVVENKDTLVQRIPNPGGVYEITVDRPEWLSVDERGGLRFSFVITEAEQERLQREESGRRTAEEERGTRKARKDSDDGGRPSSFTTWGIEYVRVDVRGTTL